jgi:transposase-like protein
MGRVLHGSATRTEAVRQAIQHSQESVRALARRCDINPKTVTKWKRRSSVTALPTGPKDATSPVLSRADESIIVAFRRHTLLSRCRLDGSDSLLVQADGPSGVQAVVGARETSGCGTFP